ncbi:MAG: HNH endonuclease [Colwellia sp.]|nr:HNH endonuclease [Colwellia sp.]
MKTSTKVKEIWKTSIDYPKYQVSNLNEFKSKNGALTLFINKCGYFFCYPYLNGKKHTILFHRLVAKTFIPNPENKPCVNHINGIKTDNRASNLEWCTYKENNNHAMENGLINSKGGDRPKLNLEIAQNIRMEYPQMNMSELSRKYKVHRNSIKKILEYKSYKNAR